MKIWFLVNFWYTKTFCQTHPLRPLISIIPTLQMPMKTDALNFILMPLPGVKWQKQSSPTQISSTPHCREWKAPGSNMICAKDIWQGLWLVRDEDSIWQSFFLLLVILVFKIIRINSPGSVGWSIECYKKKAGLAYNFRQGLNYYIQQLCLPQQ